MNRNLSKRQKVVRKLDGALTAWRYFHGPNFVHEARDRLKIRTHSDPVRALLREASARSILVEENQALFAVLVRFVEWMQAPISPWAGSPFVEFVDETVTLPHEAQCLARLTFTGRDVCLPGGPCNTFLVWLVVARWRHRDWWLASLKRAPR